MHDTCLKIIDQLNKSIEHNTDLLIENMTDPNMRYSWACIKPNLSYEYFSECLKADWEKIINEFIEKQTQTNGCESAVTDFMRLHKYYKMATPERRAELKQLANEFNEDDMDFNANSLLKKFGSINIDNIVLDVIASNILHKPTDSSFKFDLDITRTISNLGKILTVNCKCQMGNIFKYIISKYHKRYYEKVAGLSKEQLIEMIRGDYNNFKFILNNIETNGLESLILFKGGSPLKSTIDGSVINIHKLSDMDLDTDKLINKLSDLNPKSSVILDKLSTKLTALYSFSVESELDKLIPNELGSLKDFFIKVISTYYNNLHPIVWAPIFKSITTNVFVDLPFTEAEIFAFVSKHLLLNSGPFILKILQMIRPVLDLHTAKKYNLVKLTYPLLKPKQVNMVLSKSVKNWPMYQVLENFSASVGHVCKVCRVDSPLNVFIIKIIKPLAVAQSCWEYKTLYKVFPIGSCEQIFVKNMLESNGRELNVLNEISNIKLGFEHYTAEYDNIFGANIDAKLTTIENIPLIIIPDCWFALTMTLAPGMPISKLVEDNLLAQDTKFRAKLHRCLDLLVCKFFMNIVQNGFYHGDLHAGNIFFSYEKNQMTLIDFGATGKLDIYDKSEDINTLLDIVVLSIFDNFDEMFDRMTELLNSKCTESQIDTQTKAYSEFKEMLYEHRIQNTLNKDKERINTDTYKRDIFSTERIDSEKSVDTVTQKGSNANGRSEQLQSQSQSQSQSIYSYLEFEPIGKEPIIENRDVLPAFTEIIGNSQSITFAGILEKIIKFYALSGVNIAIKFNEFYEFQKAYALLMGVLHKTGYNSYRTGIAINKAIINWKNITELKNIGTVSHVIKTYWTEHNKFNDFKKELLETNIIQTGGISYLRKYLKYKKKYLNKLRLIKNI